MIPQHLVKRLFLPLFFAFVILLCFLLTAWALRARSDAVARVLYEQCVANEYQDTVIVSVLNSIPEKQRSQVVQDAITALEPPDERECKRPEGAFP